MRGGLGETLAVLGFGLGMLLTPFVRRWAASDGGGGPLGEVLLVCEALFSVAFLFGLVRLLIRGGRWLARASVRRGRRHEESP
ncbi:hypothetical protein ACFQYP_03545 [Nonomuraea antimicrobica]